MNNTKTNRKELHESLRATVGLKPRKPGTVHDPSMGRIIHTAVNTSANRHAGNPELNEVAELIRFRIEQLELVLDELKKQSKKNFLYR